MQKSLITLFFLLMSVVLCAQPSTQTDTTVTTEKAGLIKRLLNYFEQSNKPKTRDRFDFSIIGGPHYSTDTKLGIGLVAAGLYYSDPADTLMPPSTVSLYGDIATVGFYMLGLGGTHLFPHQRYRMVYDAYFYLFPSKFWGVGYARGNDGSNESKMNRFEVDASISFLFRLTHSLYTGPMLAYRYVNAHRMTRPELLDGDSPHASDIGVGLSLVFDTRDVMTNPHRGCYVTVSQQVRKQLSQGHHLFEMTDFSASGYHPLWTGGTLAAQVIGTLQFGRLDWTNMAMLGDSRSMRGYYGGRYRDKSKLETQIELRQHVYRRNGLVAWMGAGTVFPKFSSLRLRHVLPNYGIGYRWEFKRNVNLRLDYGLGKSGQSGFLFNINEAF